MEKSGTLKIFDKELKWRFVLNNYVDYSWNNFHLGVVYFNDVTVRLVPFNKPVTEGIYFNTFEEAHEKVIELLNNNIDYIRRELQSRIDTEERIEKQKQEYKDKFHHMELKDVKEDTEIYYTDLPSTRLKNLLTVMGAVTLLDVAKNSRSEFLRWRNCGKKVAEEVEEMFRIASIWWDDPKAKKKNELEKYTDDEILAECKRRGLI